MKRIEVNVQTGEVTEHELTAEEIAALPVPVVPRPAAISPRQIRMALTRLNLRQAVEQAVIAGDQDLKDWWAFSTTFERDNAQVNEMCASLGVSAEDCDALWALGATL